MTTASSLPAPKRKKNVYGKLGRSGYSTSNLDTFFDEDELPTSKPTVERQSNVKTSYAVQKTEAKASPAKTAKPRTKRQDPFDVPSSDDESQSPPKVVSPPKSRPSLFDDRNTSDAQLAPWERSRVEKSVQSRSAPARKHKTPEMSPEAQLRQELARATASPESKPSTTSSPKAKTASRKQSSPATPSVESPDVGVTSAAARLAARRRPAPSSADAPSQSGRTVPKRPVLAADDSESTPRKRARTHMDSRESSADVATADATSGPVCAALPKEENDADDVYDFPESSADDRERPKAAMARPKTEKKQSKRSNLTTYSRLAPRKGVSAPSRLVEMVGTDTDTTEPSAQSVSASTSQRSTPQQPSTPPDNRSLGSPETAIKSAGTVTPKQANLWNRLLPNDTVAASPSTLPIKDLNISAQKRSAPSNVDRRLVKSQSDIPRRRTRLVDRLKASAPSSGDELSEEDDSEDQMEEIEVVEEKVAPVTTEAEPMPKLSRRASQSQPQSQSQSQTTSTTGGGPKITYSRIRSYLPEDNLEDDLMVGLISDPPQHLSAMGRSKDKASQKSAFDLEDSDDEDGPGKMRSIHELRASGSNARGMGDIEDLLDEIEKHNASQRSTRRTALISLATNLMDKQFKGRFIGQSFEVRLASECGSYSDEIADFVLTAAISLLMTSDPPEHVIRSLYDAEVLPWLTRLLDSDMEISRVAKERRNNMSKSSQSSLVQFAEKLKKQQALWDDETPSIITPRLMAMKAIDQLVRNLRQLGHKTELLDVEQLQAVFHEPSQALEQGKTLELGLSISILESLSTTSLSLNWPSSIINDLSSILPRLDETSSSLQHSRFLALRLCLNLTNDNTRNCTLLSDDSSGTTIHHLLHAIKTGFEALTTPTPEHEDRTLGLDHLVLATGIAINLTEHSPSARHHATTPPADPLLPALCSTFRQGQKHMLLAESVEESVANVTFGYLAVLLANLCQHAAARAIVAANLPGGNLDMLVEAVEEFVRHHQKVDGMGLEGEEGREVWGAFTEKLRGVLGRLREVEGLV